MSAAGLRAGSGSVVLVLLGACSSATGPAPATHPAGSIAASSHVSARPFGIAVSAGGVVYVSQLDAASLTRFNLPGMTSTTTVMVGSTPTAVAFNGTGNTAYVANQFSQNAGVVDVATDIQRTTIPVTGDPFRVLVAPDDQTLFVSTNVDTIYRVNLATAAVVARVGFAAPVNGVSLDPSQKFLYATTLGGTVAEISLLTNMVSRTLTLGGMLQGVAVSPDGTELYVADMSGMRLKVLGIATGTVVDSVPLTGDGFDVALTPDAVQIYVSEPPAGKVEVFNRVTRARAFTIATGGTPRRIGFNRSGSTAVIANEAGWVDFIQ